MYPALSAATWGHPSATKRVLLLHGLTSSGQIWNRTALSFASRGYFVIAPDLLGHGTASRSSVYTVAAIAEALEPLFTEHASGNDPPYHVVVGHSLGGLIAAALLPLLKNTLPVSVVLVDPPLQQTKEQVSFYRTVFTEMIRNPQSPEKYALENPRWTREDAVFRALSVRLCDVATVQGVLDQNDPWSFSHLLSAAPDNVKVTVLAADPSQNWHCVREDELKPYPHVIAKTVWGASHLIPFECPEVIVETALEGADARN